MDLFFLSSLAFPDRSFAPVRILSNSKQERTKMADRFFPNTMPDIVDESNHLDGRSLDADESLTKLLWMPYPLLAERFRRAALELKETVTVETWGSTRQRVRNFTLYSGTLGTAFLLLRSYQISNNADDLALCCRIIKACDSASSNPRDWGGSFVCGRTGVCALGAVAASYAKDAASLNHYLGQFKKIKLPKNVPDELLYGRAGYLWTCLFLNKYIGEGTISASTMNTVKDEVIRNGRMLGKKVGSPLMFEWDGEKYWGAAHGLAGIIHVLMEMDLKPDEVEDVKGTLRYMIENRFPSGNYPLSKEDSDRDVLVHWCHGAPGIALTLAKAAKVFQDEEFFHAAVDAAEVVWNRGLLKRVGICHGISGNAYAFLSLYQITGNTEFLYRAKAFACFLLDRAHELISTGEMHGGDNPYSLFEGNGGMATLFLDMTVPLDARFPAYDL